MPEVAVPAESSESPALRELLGRAAAKALTHIQRHLAALDAQDDGAHAALWRRIAASLGALAPLPIQTVGHSAIMFFVPDGKYRMQMFALEDQNDGRISVYLPDVLKQAIAKKIVRKGDAPGEYAIVRPIRNTLRIEALDSSNNPQRASLHDGHFNDCVEISMLRAAICARSEEWEWRGTRKYHARRF
jgi:hypothetical protein